jgi:hypothetical protein
MRPHALHLRPASHAQLGTTRTRSPKWQKCLLTDTNRAQNMRLNRSGGVGHEDSVHTKTSRIKIGEEKDSWHRPARLQSQSCPPIPKWWSCPPLSPNPFPLRQGRFGAVISNGHDTRAVLTRGSPGSGSEYIFAPYRMHVSLWQRATGGVKLRLPSAWYGWIKLHLNTNPSSYVETGYVA